MQHTNRNGFKQLGFNNTSQGRGFGSQEQSNGYYQEQQQDDNQAVAWLNLYIQTESNENKKLGKGIPLRDSNPLERAILDLFFDEQGNQKDFDVADLKAALVMDIRPAGSPDQEVKIALGGIKKEVAAPSSPRIQRPTKAEQPVDQDAVEDLEPEVPASKPRARLASRK